MYDQYMGEIIPVGFNYTAENNGYCGGGLVDVNQNPALFSLLYVYYGGDGRTVFALPDLRGSTAISMGQGPGLTSQFLGDRYLSEYTYLSIYELPEHTHQHTYNTSPSNETTTLEATKQEGTIAVPENGAFLSATKEVGSGGADNMYVRASEVQVADLVTLGGVTDGPGAGFDNDAFIIDNAGLGREFLNMQPSLVINYQICMIGLFPSRT